jgi:hypothetical protein
MTSDIGLHVGFMKLDLQWQFRLLERAWQGEKRGGSGMSVGGRTVVGSGREGGGRGGALFNVYFLIKNFAYGPQYVCAQ